MKVKRIYAVNFRNYKECCLEITSMVNIFYGQNAQGKTNLLEAMFYAAFGMSHRTAQEDDMQRLDTNQISPRDLMQMCFGTVQRQSFY